MATKSFNRVHVVTATTGTGTLTLGAAAAANVLTFAQAGAVDGDEVNYVLEDGADFEIGIGVLGDDVSTLTRATVHLSKAGAVIGTDKIELSGSGRVRSAEPAEMFNAGFLRKGVDVDLESNPPAEGDGLVWDGTKLVPGGLNINSIAGDILPDADGERSLGSDAKAWKNIVGDNLYVDKVAKANGDTQADLVDGLAKAWANLNGVGTIALRDGLNISSVTDSGTGEYGFGLTASMDAVDYGIMGTAGIENQGSAVASLCPRLAMSTVGSVRVALGYTNTSGAFTPFDSVATSISITGDLA